MKCRVLLKGNCKINQYYSENHKALDLVGENSTLDYITAHSDGIVETIQDGYGNMKGSTGEIAYGNYVKINHNNGYHTLYAHMKNGILLRKNQVIKRGQIIGYMSDSGNAYGKHLHFELWENNERINPLKIINDDLISSDETENKLKYKIGDIVEINGVYISSTSKEKMRPLITRGKITKIITNAPNPYLLEEGGIGWINDDVIISNNEVKYLSNPNYKGNSIVDALKQINVDNSYQYRKKLAIINDIKNYRGTAEENIYMLNLLKQGILKF